jgi:hypothetical protein
MTFQYFSRIIFYLLLLIAVVSPAFGVEVVPFKLPESATPQQRLSLEILNNRMNKAHALKDVIVTYADTFPAMAESVTEAVSRCEAHQATRHPRSNTLVQIGSYCSKETDKLRKRFLVHAGLLEKFREMIPRIENEIQVIGDARIAFQAIEASRIMIDEIDNKKHQVVEALKDAEDVFSPTEYRELRRIIM